MFSNNLSSKEISDLVGNLRTYRLRSGLTQEELAKESGLSPQAVNKWETDGYNRIAFKNLVSIVKVLENHVAIPGSKELSHTANTLRQWRQRLKITQTELAEKVGVCYQSVNSWENKSYYPTTLSSLIKVIKILENLEHDSIYDTDRTDV